MTPERWQKIRDVLERALELAPSDRSAYLNQACSSDQSLRQEVETLLASSDGVRSSFLQSSSALRVTLTPGAKLGEYEVESLLGSGGMGEVYRARDSRLGRDVAIKVLPSFASADLNRLRRFEQEARAAAALNHPNILAVFQMGTYEGAPYLVSELLDGETLREQIKRGRLSVRKAVDYGVQTARGVAAAHEKGIIHRDLKPENLLVTKDGRVKILDFGLAKLTQLQSDSEHDAAPRNEGTEPGVLMGTVGYMSPEQVRGQTADHRADIFAFGAILYEMLAGKRPFQKPTSADTMSAILNEDPPGISQITTNIPPALQRVVHRCLEKNPEQRFQSASDLAFALDALSEHSGSAAVYPRTEAGGSTLLTGVKQHKWGLAAGLVLVGLLLGAVLYSTRSLRSNNVPHAKITHKQFTFLGNAYEPTISPDGLFVAYVSRKPGEQQKLVVQASNGAQLELARGATIDHPLWSPDGSEVLFHKWEPALFSVEPTVNNKGISVVSRLGGVVRPIGIGQYACWLAQDGSQVVLASNMEKSGFKGVRLVNNLTGEEKKVPLSEYVSLHDVDCSARAGLILAVVQVSDKYQIRTFKPDGSEERTLVEESAEIYSTRWSSTGDSIYYLHGKGSTDELSKVSVTRGSGQPAVLADGLETGGFFTLSADGSRLAYTREDANSNLWRVDLPTARKNAKPEISRLTTGTSHYGAPSFSPDGRWMAFALGPSPYETNLFKMPVAGGEPVQLTFFEHATSHSPAWSPDGQRIAFIGDQNGTPRVWTISANGGTAQPVGNPNGWDPGNNHLAWWPSSDLVYQQTGVRNFLRINEKTHEEKPLIQHDQSVGWVPYRPVFSPDGKKMAVYWNRKEEGLWVISLEPYAETQLESGAICPFGWSPDGKYVYAVRMEAGREIIRVQVATPNEVTSVATLPGNFVDDDASVGPDGKAIFASVSEEKSDVWLMENFDPSPP
jgi:eukaryotic-like serine/threonine-protein kinase